MKWTSLMLVAVSVCPLLAGQQAAPAEANPFFEEWKTPFGVPPFSRITNEHFLPALQKGIAQP